MSVEPAAEFEKYARDCVELAHQPNMPPEVREQLLQMARDWMKAGMMKGKTKATSDVVDAASKRRRPSR
jgi:hypothetical protein